MSSPGHEALEAAEQPGLGAPSPRASAQAQLGARERFQPPWRDLLEETQLSQHVAALGLSGAGHRSARQRGMGEPRVKPSPSSLLVLPRWAVPF